MDVVHLYHVSNPLYRESIIKEGLVPGVGPSYKAHYDTGTDTALTPKVFVCTHNKYDSTYNDDRWLITLPIKVYNKLEFKLDKDVLGVLYTTQIINNEYLKLIYLGTGLSII